MTGLQLVCLLAALALAALMIARPALARRYPRTCWIALGFPVAVLRLYATWRRLTVFADLAVSRRPRRRLVGGDLIVWGDPLRPIPPRFTPPIPTGNGFRFHVRMHAGQVPDDYVKVSVAMAHAWHVYAVRVTSPGRGWLRIEATASDPLAVTSVAVGGGRSALLRAVVGRREDGRPWVLDFRTVPHWLIVGATRSGKSTLLNALMVELVSQPLALVGIDCKGGMELAAYAPRLSALATDRREAVGVLAGMVELLGNRMRLCRRQHARNIWELPEHLRPVPVVLLVDEVAELFLVAQRSEKDEAARAATLLIRIAQLGAALGLHLVVAGQRVGSDLGSGVTALRAQLAGRVCHRVADPETAVMALGDLNPDALVAAQAIGTDQPGVAVIADETGAWQRARSVNVPPALAELTARRYASLTPELLELTAGLRAVGADLNDYDDEGRQAA